jgi:hypothetical protein
VTKTEKCYNLGWRLAKINVAAILSSNIFMLEIVVNVNNISKKLLQFVTCLKTIYVEFQLWSRSWSRSRIALRLRIDQMQLLAAPALAPKH